MPVMQVMRSSARPFFTIDGTAAILMEREVEQPHAVYV